MLKMPQRLLVVKEVNVFNLSRRTSVDVEGHRDTVPEEEQEEQ